ncbi:MAG: FlgD immunoglobulin-like domain containing protein [Candidatus Eisenbacteria bacterium]
MLPTIRRAARVAPLALALLLSLAPAGQARRFPPGPGNAYPDTLTIVNVQSPSAVPVLTSPDTVYGIGGIITGFDAKSSGYGFYIQRSGGLPYTGVDIFTGSYNKAAAPYNLAIGDSVVVYGRVQVFQGEAEIEGYDGVQGTDDCIVRVVSSGNPLPPFFVGTTTQLKETPTNTTAEAYEGMLARINQTGSGTLKVARVTGLGANAFIVVDSAAPSDSVFIDGATLATYPAPALGTPVTFVQGIVNQRARGYRIQLRDGNDILTEAPPNLTDAWPMLDQVVRVVFDRPVTTASATNPAHYSLASLGAVLSASMVSGRQDAADVTISNGLPHGALETITATGIVGLANGLVLTTAQSRTFVNGVLSCAEVQAPNPDSLAASPCLDMSRFAGGKGQSSQGPLGPRCTVQGVVSGHYGAYDALADAAGGARSGLLVFGVPLTLAAGRLVKLVGGVQEFFGETELSGIQSVFDGGTTAVPVPVTPLLGVLDHDGCDPSQGLDDAEDYEGRLVRVANGRVVLAAGLVTPPTNGFHVANLAGTDTIFVSNFNGVLDPFVAPTLGAAVNVTGVLHYSSSSFRICPRSPADVEQVAQLAHVLTVTTDGSGVVQRSPAGDTLAAGSVVTLSAVANPGHVFAGWTGDTVTSANPLTLVVNADRFVTAHFQALPRYAVNAVADSGGAVTRTPSLATYALGDTVWLTATPEPGSVFTGWGGDTVAWKPALRIVVDRPLALVAHFLPTARTRALCARVHEGETAHLGSADQALIFAVEFASYGTPVGVCGFYQKGACDAVGSLAVVESLALGRTTCDIAASSALFGEPCANLAKELVIQYRVASTQAPAPRESLVCAIAAEGDSLTLRAPAGMRIGAVEFASFGTPQGDTTDCASLAQGPCHAPGSQSMVEEACLGATRLAVLASESVFGDACPGTAKRLAVRLRCVESAPDLAITTPDGWGEPIVPRSDSSATVASSTQEPLELFGDSLTTWFSAAARVSDLAVAADWRYRLAVDGRALGDYPMTFEASPTWDLFTQRRLGPFAIAGGWHTLTGVADATELVPEFDETNNVASHQWLWRPARLAWGVPRSRIGPPEPGSGAHAQCDAFRVDRDPRYAWVVAVHSPVASADVDLGMCTDYSGPTAGLAGEIARSEATGTAVDFIAGLAAGPPMTLYPTVTLAAGDAATPYVLEYDDSRQRFSDVGTGIWTNRAMPADRSVHVYDLYFETLTPHHLALVSHGGGALGFEVLGGGAGSVHARGSGGAAAHSVAASDSLDSLVFVPNRVGWHPVVVYRDGPGGALTYTFLSQDHPVLDAGGAVAPTRLALSGVAPNPIEREGVLVLSLPRAAAVTVEVLDVAGRRVRTLEAGARPAGLHTLRWNACDAGGHRVAPGLYLVQARVGDWREVRRVVVR